METFFVWLESTPLSTWLRDTPSLFAFPAVLIAHTIGMVLLAGVNAALDLCILGAVPGVALPGMRRYFPIMWFGFWLNAASGVLLLIAYPTKALTNPVFYLKLSLIATALLILKTIGRRVFDDPAAEPMMPRTLKAFAAASLACWLATIITGRLLAYTYSRLTAI